MTKIKIKDFQSIGHADIEVDGFTVIVGRNNIGKSALVRAIDASLTNAPGNQYVRKGQKSTEVKLEHGNMMVVWKKGDASVYTVNGENFSKLNRAIPKPLSDAGFGKIEVGDFKLNPTVAHQFEEIFLLDEPGSAITEILASLYDLDVISKADDLCQKELKGSKTTVKTRELDLKTVKDQLEKYKDFDALKKEVESIAQAEIECDKLKAQIESIARYEESLQKLVALVSKLKQVSKVDVPDVSDLDNLSRTLEKVSEKEAQLIALYSLVKKLSGIASIAIPDVKETDKLTSDLAKVRELSISYTDTEKAVSKLGSVVIDVPDISTLESEYEAVNAFVTMEENFLTLAKEFKETRTQMKDVIDKLQTAKTELDAYKTCPTCERPF